MDTKTRIIAVLIVVASFSLCVCGFAKGRAFTTLDGEDISYEELVASPKTILFVWTTWCPYCRQELKRLSDESVFFDDVAVYFINTGESPAVVRRFADKNEIRAQFRKKIILDRNGFVAGEFRISAIPSYIFLKDKKPIQRSYYLDPELLHSVFEE